MNDNDSEEGDATTLDTLVGSAELPTAQELQATRILEALGVQLPQAGSGPAETLDLAVERIGGDEGPAELTEDSLGRFLLRGEIGRGGMGRVLAAEDPELGRIVAIKVLIDPKQVRHEQLQRFVAEARITSQLEHPNIVPVHDLGVSSEGLLYFVMKRVEGQSLEDLLVALGRGNPEASTEWSRHRLLNAFVQVCNAVAYAHERGVLHRDLKPANIMLGRFGQVLLMDWGVARVVDELTDKEGTASRTAPVTLDGESNQSTLVGTTVGTPGYMAPEQAAGDPASLSARSDVWSLGAVLYELLTYRPAFTAPSALRLLYVAAQSKPEDPRTKAPDRNIPDEIAEICLKSLARNPGERFTSALELAQAVQAFLEGSRRKEAAASHVAAADRAWGLYRQVQTERASLEERARVLAGEVPPWASLKEKAELLFTRSQIEGLGQRRVDLFEEVISGCEQALSQDPANAGARSLLAQVHYSRFEEAEKEGDLEEMLGAERRVLRYDDGSFAPLIRGTGALTLRTEPPGTEVLCREVHREGLVWPLGGQRSLGHTPLIRIPMEKGSYLLTLRRPGKADTVYPIYISRGHHWDSGPSPIPLFDPSVAGEDFIYIPSGPFLAGGDPNVSGETTGSTPWIPGFFISRKPVTMSDYLDYINALHTQDPEAAWQQVPRFDKGSPYWERPSEGELYEIPEVDRDGDAWDPRFPVFGISWDDARAYAAWMSLRTGQAFDLPSEHQWEKAGRGVDGRFFPWGDRFDPSLCKMTESRAARPHLEVIGAFETDRSVYEVEDLAGTIREWCLPSSDDPGGDPAAVRGGSWYSNQMACRLAARNGYQQWMVTTSIGFRLACALPDPH